MDVRLPAHLEAAALLREVQAAGGFATVLRKGDADAGAILVVLVENGLNGRLYERMPSLEGGRIWQCSQRQDPDDPQKFNEYLARRAEQDRDAWLLELDIVEGERFIDIVRKAG